MSQASERTRRTVNLRSRGRAAKVVESVVTATAEELGRVGYAALRVEDVAARSGVHKTTIYRRWPTKAELVAATIATMIAQGEQRRAVDTGTVRSDLRASLLAALDLKPSERGVLRIMQVERAMPEVNALARRFRDEVQHMRLAMVRRGVARGELPKGVDAELIVDLVSAPVQRALLLDESMDARALDGMLDVVLAGAAACAAKVTARGSRKRVAKRRRKARDAR
jgi:AcrR family transcriptional regulator